MLNFIKRRHYDDDDFENAPKKFAFKLNRVYLTLSRLKKIKENSLSYVESYVDVEFGGFTL